MFKDMDDRLVRHFEKVYLMCILSFIVISIVFLFTGLSYGVLLVGILAAVPAVMNTIKIIEVRMGSCEIYEGRVTEYVPTQSFWAAVKSNDRKNTRALLTIKAGNEEDSVYLTVKMNKNMNVNTGDTIRVYANPNSITEDGDNSFWTSDYFLIDKVRKGQ